MKNNLTGWKYGSIGLERANVPFPFSTGHLNILQREIVLKYDGTTPYVTLTETFPLTTLFSGIIKRSNYRFQHD